MTVVEQKLRKIVSETFLVEGESQELLGDDSFIEKGIIDSTGILQLVEFVEQEFELKVEDEDLIPENLDSINRLVAFIDKKMQASATAVPPVVSCSTSDADLSLASSASN